MQLVLACFVVRGCEQVTSGQWSSGDGPAMVIGGRWSARRRFVSLERQVVGGSGNGNRWVSSAPVGDDWTRKRQKWGVSARV